MTFARPAILLLLVLPVGLLFWEWVRRGHVIALPFDHSGRRRHRWLQGLVLCANSLPAALLALAILILAHPVRLMPPTVERKLTNVQILLDTSPSMKEPYGPQPATGRFRRFDGAMQALDRFIEYRQGDAFGLTIFSRDFIQWVPLTTETNAIRLAAPFVQPRDTNLPKEQQRGFPMELWTNTYLRKALLGVIDQLAARPQGDRMILVLTDGLADDFRGVGVGPVITQLQAAQVSVYAVLLIDHEEDRGLRSICRQTGGEMFNAATPEALAEVFKRIDAMKKVELRQRTPQLVDDYRPFFLPAAITLALSALVLLGLRFTPW